MSCLHRLLLSTSTIVLSLYLVLDFRQCRVESLEETSGVELIKKVCRCFRDSQCCHGFFCFCFCLLIVSCKMTRTKRSFLEHVDTLQPRGGPGLFNFRLRRLKNCTLLLSNPQWDLSTHLHPPPKTTHPPPPQPFYNDQSMGNRMRIFELYQKCK